MKRRFGEGNTLIGFQHRQAGIDSLAHGECGERLGECCRRRGRLLGFANLVLPGATGFLSNKAKAEGNIVQLAALVVVANGSHCSEGNRKRHGEVKAES